MANEHSVSHYSDYSGDPGGSDAEIILMTKKSYPIGSKKKKSDKLKIQKKLPDL